MSLQSSKVKLLALDSRHILKAFEWRNDYSIYKWCRQYEPLSIDNHQEWFQNFRKDRSIKMYSVHASDDFVGVCGLTSIDYINSTAEFSLYISPMHMGMGYGKSALSELLKHAFNVLNLNCVWGESFKDNPALSLFLKLGFKQEGLRRSFYYREGKYIDCHLVSILKHEWSSAV